ncbi:MAG: HAMP domain-containing histidine kinase [Anaerolineales bacterium]|nr:HAMP domain-containing histidine kinase [Anaerolineales bacterium]
MMKSIRSRLVLSHTLPFLVIAPLVAVTLFYLLQAQERLTAVSAQLAQQAQQIAQWSNNQPGVWSDTQLAQLFVVEVISQELPDNRRLNIMLIRPTGQVLATSNPQNTDQVGQPIDLPEMRLVLSQQDGYLRLQAEVANMYVPVIRDNQVVGLVSLSQELDAVTAGVLRLRYLLLAALIGEALLGIVFGFWLALRFERDLAAMTTAVTQIDSAHPEKLPENGPREFQAFSHAYNALVDRLRELEESRSNLLANTVHELARPLGAMRSAIQALRYGADADPAFRAELLAGMDAQVERLQPLLNNLVQLHGQVLGKIELKRQPTPLGNWLREVAIPWQAAAQEKGIVWHNDISAELPTLSVDADKLAQAVGNLLSNSVKYTPAGGTVTLHAANGGDTARISVSDSGPGIPQPELERIFEPLYRGKNGSRFPQGMGLGLAIARDLVQAHNGRLEVTSTLGTGSEFTVWLPVQ